MAPLRLPWPGAVVRLPPPRGCHSEPPGEVSEAMFTHDHVRFNGFFSGFASLKVPYVATNHV